MQRFTKPQRLHRLQGFESLSFLKIYGGLTERFNVQSLNLCEQRCSVSSNLTPSSIFMKTIIYENKKYIVDKVQFELVYLHEEENPNNCLIITEVKYNKILNVSVPEKPKGRVCKTLKP